jgi:hypothetical protein
MGNLNSGRPGGNPDLVKHRFTSDRPEPLTEKLTLRLAGSTMEFLKSLGKDYPEFVRQAIAEKREREAAPTATKTETTAAEPVGQPQQRNQTTQATQEAEKDPSQQEQAKTPRKPDKEPQNQGQKQGRPKNPSRSRKSSTTETTTEQDQLDKD